MINLGKTEKDILRFMKIMGVPLSPRDIQVEYNMKYPPYSSFRSLLKKKYIKKSTNFCGEYVLTPSGEIAYYKK